MVEVLPDGAVVVGAVVVVLDPGAAVAVVGLAVAVEEVCTTVSDGSKGAEVDDAAATVAAGTRSGEGRVVTSSRTLETADVARSTDAAVAASHAKA